MKMREGIEKVKNLLEKYDEKIDKFLKHTTKVSVGLLVCSLMVCGSLKITTNAYGEITLNSGEEVLLQKDKLVNDIIVCKDGLNGFQASSKTICLSEAFSEEQLKKLADNGYYIYITDDQADINLPEPVKVSGKKITVSTHSVDDDLIDVVKNLI